MQEADCNPNATPEHPEPDYYWEDGKVVFTSSFLSKRGYCCGSGCRHCPYGYTKDQEINPMQDSKGHRECLPASS